MCSVWKFPGEGSNWSCSCWPIPQPQRCGMSHVCDLYHSSWQWRIVTPLSETRDRNCILMDACWVCYCSATRGTPRLILKDAPFISLKDAFLIITTKSKILYHNVDEINTVLIIDQLWLIISQELFLTVRAYNHRK